ncbi:dynein light chain Tctex-type 1 [Acipenser ruthenus]|nr:dynein light chain Tctex-type 1 [Acipenser ruthenus]
MTPLEGLHVTAVRMRSKWSTGSTFSNNMEEFQTGEETTFVVDEISTIIKESVEGAIGGNAYQHSRVNQWSTNVVEQCLSQLTKLGKPFKYIVTCIIMQKNGAGLQTASSCFWDNSTDGSCTVRWENKSMYCIVSVFGLAL